VIERAGRCLSGVERRAARATGCCRPRRAPGFTLIELMIVLAVMALLATLVVPVAEVTVQRSREQELRLALREIRSAIDAYKKASDEGRVAKKADSTGYPETLEVLVEGVDDAKDPKKRRIYFLRRVPRDPMHPDTSVEPGQTWAKRSYESEPNEPREGKDVYDVFSRSMRVGLNGIPYDRW
jgi:prepilin-type N-terminal cleavage/methylation domain-containing protein